MRQRVHSFTIFVFFFLPQLPLLAHVAYVRSKSGNSTTQIILDQVENEGGALKTGYTLQQTIDGVSGQLYSRGQPVSYWRKKPTFKFTLQNKLGDDSNAGQDALASEAINSYIVNEANFGMERKTLPKPSTALENAVRSKYDFSNGVLGKHYKARLDGHTITIHKEDGTTLIKNIKRVRT